MTTPMPELPVGAWAKRINIGTEFEQYCFSPDQYGDYQEPFCKFSDAIAAIEASQLSDKICDLTNQLHDANQSIANLEANLRAAIEASQVQSIDDIHSCSFFCELPACVKTQRDLLRDKLTKETK